LAGRPAKTPQTAPPECQRPWRDRYGDLDQHEWRQPHTEHTIIGLELDDHGLVAVGSHEQDLLTDGLNVLHGTLLECAAVTLELRGARLPDVDPLDEDGATVTLGRYLIEVMLSDVVDLDRLPVARTVVARENRRSLRLCDRVGIRSERPDPDPRFVQRSGAFS
jgi:hypothetical protein